MFDSWAKLENNIFTQLCFPGRIRFNPCSPEGFSQTYFPKGGVVATPPLDYQY